MRAIITWLAIFPLVAIGMTAISPLTIGWHPVLRSLVLTLIVVPLAVYVVVPRLLALHQPAALEAWFNQPDRRRPGRRCDFGTSALGQPHCGEHRRNRMKRILITGSTDGVGRATAEALLGDGHQVVVHARTTARLAAVRQLIDGGAEAIVGDLSSLDEVHDLVEQANSLGPFDAGSSTTPASCRARCSRLTSPPRT